jgi:hypothetical protein
MILISFGRYDVLWAAGITLAAVGAFFAFRTPEPARTALDLAAVVCGGDVAEREELLARHVAGELVVRITDQEGEAEEHTYSQPQLAEQLLRLDATRPGCSFTLEDWRVRPRVGGTEWLEGTLAYSESQPGDLHAERRPFRALFGDVARQPRLISLLLGPVERRQPEARP